jgi:[protein-PII] uridylyltransferase
LGISIVRADVYTRAGGLALDVFEVRDLDQRHAPDADRLGQFAFLLEGALSEPPRFASVWAGQFHKTVPRKRPGPPRVEFDNEGSSEHTIVRVQAPDRLGLLHDLLRAMAQAGINIAQATVETDRDLACDLFFVTDLRGGKVWNSARLERIRKAIVRSGTF